MEEERTRESGGESCKIRYGENADREDWGVVGVVWLCTGFDGGLVLSKTQREVVGVVSSDCLQAAILVLFLSSSSFFSFCFGGPAQLIPPGAKTIRTITTKRLLYTKQDRLEQTRNENWD